jgi:hypothetical protein
MCGIEDKAKTQVAQRIDNYFNIVAVVTVQSQKRYANNILFLAIGRLEDRRAKKFSIFIFTDYRSLCHPTNILPGELFDFRVSVALVIECAYPKEMLIHHFFNSIRKQKPNDGGDISHHQALLYENFLRDVAALFIYQSSI